MGGHNAIWLKRKNGQAVIVNAIHDIQCDHANSVFDLYSAFEADHLGRILFDDQHYWIYDGEFLTIDEQEQVAKFINTNLLFSWST